MAKETKNTKALYSVNARITVISSVTVTASNLDEALAKAKELKQDEFVDIIGEHIDSSFEIFGVTQDAGWNLNEN